MTLTWGNAHNFIAFHCVDVCNILDIKYIYVKNWLLQQVFVFVCVFNLENNFFFVNSATTNVIRTSTMVIILWEFLMFYQMFFSPQVRRGMIIIRLHFTSRIFDVLPNVLFTTSEKRPDYYQVTIYFWWKESLVKHQKLL